MQLHETLDGQGMDLCSCGIATCSHRRPRHGHMWLTHDLDFTLMAVRLLHMNNLICRILLQPDYVIDLAFWSIQMQHVELKENMVH